MKKITSILVVFAAVLAFSFWGGQLQAQCCGASYAANEIGTRLFSVQDASRLGGKVIDNKKVHFGFLNGIHYKRYWNYTAFRIGMGYTTYDQERTSPCVDCNIVEEGKVQGGYLRAGYEFIAVMNYVEPYFAIDALGYYGTYQGVTEETGTGTEDLFIEDTYKRTAFGVSPAFGVRFFFAPGVSLGLETTIDLLQENTRIQTIQSAPTTSVDSRRESGFKLIFNPLNSASINVMF